MAVAAVVVVVVVPVVVLVAVAGTAGVAVMIGSQAWRFIERMERMDGRQAEVELVMMVRIHIMTVVVVGLMEGMQPQAELVCM